MLRRREAIPESALLERLKSARVQVEAADVDTLFLRNVPTYPRFFNKPATNLLIKRPENGELFLVWWTKTSNTWDRTRT